MIYSFNIFDPNTLQMYIIFTIVFSNLYRYLSIYSPSITMNSRNIFLIFTHQNFSWTKHTSDKETFFLDKNLVEGPKFDGVVISDGEIYLAVDFRRWCRCWQYFHHGRFPLWYLHWEVNWLTNRNWSDVHSFHLLSMHFHAISASNIFFKKFRAPKISQHRTFSRLPLCHM